MNRRPARALLTALDRRVSACAARFAPRFQGEPRGCSAWPRTLLACLLLAGLASACGHGASGPAALDPLTETCASCRMPVSDPHFASQITAPGEEPRFFDDIGCLRVWLVRTKQVPEGASAWVADHRTGAWIPAANALYTEAPGLETPMSSHWIAHADEASRGADPAASGGKPLTPDEVFGPALLPEAKP